MAFTKITNAGFGLTTGTLVGVAASFSSTVSVGGTLTYEDVTNVDSVGLITARNGIEVTDKGVQVGTGATVDSAADNTLTFLTNGSERLRIKSNGNIGINETDPDQKLHILDTAAGVRHPILLQNRTNDDSSVGIQFIASGSDVSDGQFATIEAQADTAGNTKHDLLFKTVTNGGTPTERLRITSAGRVGIATASPDSVMELHVGNGSGNANTLILTRQFSSNYCAITWKTESGGTTDWSLGQNASGDFEVFHAGADAQTAFTIKDSGSSAYHVLPGDDNTQDLGSSSLRWANIYSADLQLSNEGMGNDVDGTWGQYTIQEGENDLFLLNRRNGKKYRFMLEEVN